MFIARQYWKSNPLLRYCFATAQKDYYAILGLSRKASAEQIKEAWRNLAKKYHPDVNTTGVVTHEPDGEKFKQVAEAYAVLSHEESKVAYDLLNQAQPERIFKKVRDEQEMFYTTRDDTGQIKRTPLKKGSYAEEKQKILEEERKKFNVDQFGRYKGGLPVRGKGPIRQGVSGSSLAPTGMAHDTMVHRMKSDYWPDHQTVTAEDALHYGHYTNMTKWETSRRKPLFEAKVDYDYIKFHGYRTGWRWFRNIAFFLFGLPAFAEMFRRWQNKIALKKLLEFKKLNPTATKLVVQDREIIIGSTGIVRWA